MQVGCTSNDYGVYRAYDNVSVIAVEKHKKNIVKCKPAQPVARAQHGARDSFTFPAEVFEVSKYLNPFPVKAEMELRRNFKNTWAVYLWRVVLHW